MFHSSGSRHEQYLIRSNASKATLNKKRPSLESELSGADSGYTSSSSTPSTSPTTATSIANVSDTIISNHVTSPNHDLIIIAPPPPPSPMKKKRPKKHTPPRQPDLVYSCPRPLAFPFHNDDHFLPIAEADPRDVARVSPSLHRSSSLQSSKISIGSTRMYENNNCSSSNSQRALDAESSYSRQSSFLSIIQRGTVRSIRSFFQLAETQSKNLSRVPTTNTTKTNYSSSASILHPPLQKLEIKKGTVQSIKDMFTLRRNNIQAQHVTPLPPPPPRQPKGRVSAAIGQFESAASSSTFNYSRASIAAFASKKNNNKPAAAAGAGGGVQINVTPPASSRSKSLRSRAAEFASRTLWKPKNQELPKPNTYTTPATKPLPKDPTERKTLKSEVKKISARVMALPKKWAGTTPSTANSNNASLPVPDIEAPRSKRTLFASFRRSDVAASVVDNKKKGVDTATQDETTPPPVSTKVGKMWKSFKGLVSGKKPTRIGIIS